MNTKSLSNLQLFVEIDKLERLLQNEDFVDSSYVDDANETLDILKSEAVERYRLLIGACLVGQ